MQSVARNAPKEAFRSFRYRKYRARGRDGRGDDEKKEGEARRGVLFVFGYFANSKARSSA